jgi:transposase-like protein
VSGVSSARRVFTCLKRCHSLQISRRLEQHGSPVSVHCVTALAIKELKREVRQLRQANEILRKASAYFSQAELDRPFKP